MNKKKYILGSLAILIALAFYLMYRAGYVPILGHVIAGHKINAYATETYGVDEKTETNFNFYSGGGYSSNDGYLYHINTNLITALNRYENAGTDTPYKQDYQKIIATLGEDINFEDYSISYTVDADDFSREFYKLTVYDLESTEDLTAEESHENPAKIVMKFIDDMEIQYNFTGVTITYKDKNGKYNIAYSSEEPITFDLLLNNTVKDSGLST